MPLELIVDRTDADVSRAYYLNGRDIREMTPEEVSELLSAPKGAYGHEDYNRVEAAVEYLSDRLSHLGYTAPITTIKTDWTDDTVFNIDDMDRYLANVQALKASFYGTVALPETMRGIAHTGANNIERLLLEIEGNITRLTSAYRHSGTFYSGQGGLRA